MNFQVAPNPVPKETALTFNLNSERVIKINVRRINGELITSITPAI
jgi:hypothetical protein